ncbi:hypothetical protein [Tatumella terrea]|uniref:Cupin domain-containing protein n=1 Tax=Tatumella terrea TaxID=419007 RepID=A0ABW1VZZ6_9GAMM
MEKNNIENMTRGWFVGPFEPSVFRTSNMEVAVKYYRAGDHEAAHYHKVATEITVIVSGAVRMSGQYFNRGDIITIEPGQITDFYAVEDSVTTVVKIPGANNDKYIAEEII